MNVTEVDRSLVGDGAAPATLAGAPIAFSLPTVLLWRYVAESDGCDDNMTRVLIAAEHRANWHGVRRARCREHIPVRVAEAPIDLESRCHATFNTHLR